MSILNSLNRLENYVIKNNYIGNDPYDTLKSYIPFKKLGKWPAAIATQIQKRNPINIRPILGVKKDINPKAFGLFLQAYCVLYAKTGDKKYINKAKYFYDWLIQNYSKGYSGMCWGYNFPWANPSKYMDAGIPSSVVSGFVAKGIYEYYLIIKEKTILNALQSICQFLDKDLDKVFDSSGHSISYTPIKKDVCFNASLLAAEIFAKTGKLIQDDYLIKNAQNAVNFVLDKQRLDGKWAYEMNVELTKEFEQTDFHQGYILESIFEISKVLAIKNQKWENAIIDGLKFYYEQQFHKSGRSYWRLPKKYPIEIHNQAQGIITFKKLASYLGDAELFSEIIAKWTISNMQSKKGYFYYQKFLTHTNKISYMRWSNAWMFLALSHIIQETK